MTPPRYKVRVSPLAKAEIDSLYNFIANKCFHKETAEKYILGIHEKIGKLAWIGGSIGISTNRNLQGNMVPP